MDIPILSFKTLTTKIDCNEANEKSSFNEAGQVPDAGGSLTAIFYSHGTAECACNGAHN
jgi:hypothetical protein